MDLELDEDQLALQEAARSVLATACPPALVRAVFDGDTSEVPDLWATLVSLDWPGLGFPADVGGVGLGVVETAVVVEELGRVVAPGPYLATVTQLGALLRAAGSGPLAAVATGAVTGAVAWTSSVGAVPDGAGWVLTGAAPLVLDGATADVLAVATDAGVFLVPASAVTATPLEVLDPTLPLADLAFDGVRVSSDAALAAAAVDGARLEATAMLALSTVATCRTIFETTLQYAKDRQQFGRAIGSFQAVKHRLADCYLAVERAHSLAWYAVCAVAESSEERTVAVSMAKAAAGECQELLVRDGLQLHGGVGFTWEHDLHFALKRAIAGDLLLGTAAHHRARLATLLGLIPSVSAQPTPSGWRVGSEDVS